MVGILHWYLFMTLGDPKWKSFDWMGTHQTMFSVIHESIYQKKIPYHVKCYDLPIIGDPIEEGTSGSYNVRWFALGGNIISPQNLIFGFLDTPKIMLLNILFYFSISFFGMVLWMKKLNLSHFSSVFLFICWSFSGFITSKMGVGHLGSTNGYFFIPLYFWIINQFLIENYRDKTNLEILKDAIVFSIFIFFVKLNNNGQNVYQFLLIGLIVSIFYYKRFMWYLLSLIFSFFFTKFLYFPNLFLQYLYR